MISAKELLDNIEKIRISRGENKKQFYENSGAGRSFPDNLKKSQMPSFDKVLMIADYAGVSIETLIGKGEPIAIKASESEWDVILNSMSDESLLMLRDYAKFLLWRQAQAVADTL